MTMDLRIIAIRIAADHTADINKLSDNLLKRLAGFVDEVENLTDEIMGNAGNKSIWEDRKHGAAQRVKSAIEQLLHLTGEFQSLSGYLEKRYNNKNIKTVISKLVDSLNDMSKSGKKGLLQSYDDYVDKVRGSYDLIKSRVRTCRAAIDQLAKLDKKTDEKDPLDGFSFDKV